jgi:hypothetical protein
MPDGIGSVDGRWMPTANGGTTDGIWPKAQHFVADIAPVGAVGCRQHSGPSLLTTARRMVRRGDSGLRSSTRRQPSIPVVSRRYGASSAAALVGADADVSDR